jgi:hypothetical protein
MPLATCLCPRTLPASPVQDMPAHLPNDEPRQPCIVVPKPHPNVELSHRTTDVSPLVQKEVHASTMKQPLARRAVRKDEEMSTSRYSPIAKTALAPPSQSLALYMRAEPSRPSNNKLKMPSLVTHQRYNVEGIVSLETEMDVDAYRVVAPNISLSMDPPHPAEVRWLGNGSPSPGEIQPSKSGTKKIVSAKQSRQR